MQRIGGVDKLSPAGGQLGPKLRPKTNSPLVVLVGVRVDNVPDEAVVVTAVSRARVDCHANQVVLVALSSYGLTFLTETCRECS